MIRRSSWVLVWRVVSAGSAKETTEEEGLRAEGTVLEESRGVGGVDGWSEAEGAIMGGRRGCWSATSS